MMNGSSGTNLWWINSIGKWVPESWTEKEMIQAQILWRRKGKRDKENTRKMDAAVVLVSKPSDGFIKEIKRPEM